MHDCLCQMACMYSSIRFIEICCMFMRSFITNKLYNHVRTSVRKFRKILSSFSLNDKIRRIFLAKSVYNNGSVPN
jgi:hypothetical protein